MRQRELHDAGLGRILICQLSAPGNYQAAEICGRTDYIDRSEFDSPEVDNEVIIKGAGEYLRTGDFVLVKITGASEFDLTGTPLK